MGGEVEVPELFLGSGANLALHALPPGVLLLQLVGLCHRQEGVLLGQQLERPPRGAQSPARVQSRRDAEGDALAGERARLDARALHQRRKSRPDMARIDALQAQVHDGAVLAGEGNHVRHGGDGRQIDARHGRFLAAQRVHQLEGHARAAEPGAGIIVQ